MEPETLLKLGALYHLALAAFHAMFWRLWNWRDELPKLSVVNRAVMQILNLRLTYLLVLIAVLSWAYASDFATTSLGRALAAGIALCWLMRAVEQYLFFPKYRWWRPGMALVFAIGGLPYALVALAGA